MSYIVGVLLLIAASVLLQIGCRILERPGERTALHRFLSGDIFALFLTALFAGGGAALLSAPLVAMTVSSVVELAVAIAIYVAALVGLRLVMHRSPHPVAKPAAPLHA